MNDPLILCWTTEENRQLAEELAEGSVREKLAVCAQVDGPICSFYSWQGQNQCAEEFRICFKTFQPELLQKWVLNRHSYDCPQWIWVKVDGCSAAYLQWAKSSNN